MENLAPLTMKAVIRELKELTNNPIEGVTVILKEEDLTDITAHISGPSE